MKLYRTLQIALSLLIALVVVAVFFLKTTTGAKIILRHVSSLKIETISGSLLGKLELKNIKYHDYGVDAAIQNIQSETVFNLFTFSVVSQNLSITNAQVNLQLPKLFHQTTKNDNKFPLNVLLQKINLKNFTLVINKQPLLAIDSVNAKLDLSAHKVFFSLYDEQHQNPGYLEYFSSDKTTFCNLNLPEHPEHVWGQGHVVIAGKEIPELALHLTQGDAKIQLEGKLFDQWQIHWLIQAPNIQKLLSAGKGTILSEGQIAGPLNSPILNGTLNGKDIALFGINAQSVNGKFVGDLAKNYSSLYLIAKNANFNQYVLDEIKLNVNGSVTQHQVAAQLQKKQQKLNLILDGTYENPTWSGRLKNLTMQSGLEVWSLFSPALFRINKNSQELTLDNLCLASKSDNICINGTYQPRRTLEGSVNINNFNLSLLNFLLPAQNKLEGRLTLKATANPKIGYDDIKVAATLSPGAFYYTLNNTKQKLNFTNGTLSAYLDQNKTLQSQLFLKFPKGELRGQLAIPRFELDKKHLLKQNLSAQIIGNFMQPKLVEYYIPYVKNMQGQVQGKVTVNGTLQEPKFLGQVNLNDGSFRIPELNLKVTNVQLHVRGEQKTLLYDGKMQSGNGVLTFKGNTIFNKNQFPILLEIEGNNVIICNKPEIKIFATPHINLTLLDNYLSLSGIIRIPEATIHPHDFGTTETLSDDVVYVQPNGKPLENSNLKIKSAIQLILGDKISLNYRGIKGKVLGQLQINDDPSSATVGYGELRIEDGTYNIYGKTLQIDYGKFNFTGGPISNPGLDIRASRSFQTAGTNSLLSTQEQLRVGVGVLGTLRQPKINLFSEPAGKSSADILSYLVLGMPANSVSGANADILMQAADAINVGGTSKLMNLKNQVKQGLGLSELDIGSTTEFNPKTQETIQHTAFVLGKYLSPKFYVNYSLDIFDHTNTLKVRYLLNKFWTVQSVSTTAGSGIDILYTVERN